MSYIIYSRTLANGLQVHVELGNGTMTLALPHKDCPESESDMPDVSLAATVADLHAMGFTESGDAALNTAVRSMLTGFGYEDELE